MTFIVYQVCVEYFYKAKKGFKETYEQECVYLALASQAPMDSLTYRESSQLPFFFFFPVCVVNLKQEFG